MVRDVSIEEAINVKNAVFIDARSEGEFADATIPGALNIPLFNNEERAIVGTLFKQKGPKAAKMKGIELIGPKLAQMIAKYLELKEKDTNIVVFCWRGGMRSKSIATILQLMDLSVYRIIGGYKAYRGMVNNFFAREKLEQKVVVLRGLTGVGKTELLWDLNELGMPVIDLEGLANNRGSVFGAVGLEPPPSQKMFDSLLMDKINEFKDSKYIIVECESKKVGRLFVPDILMKGMQEGLQFLIYDDIENRVKRIVTEYTKGGDNNTDQLKRAVGCLQDSLGKERTNLFNELVEKQEYEQVVKYLLEKYYDPLYNYPDHPTEDYKFSIKNDNIPEAVHKIKAYLECYFR